MNLQSDPHDRDHLDSLFLYALDALPATEIPTVEAHISECTECGQQVETLRLTIGSFVSWPTDVLRPSPSLWGRLANRIAKETSKTPVPRRPQIRVQPEWDAPAPGISCQLLATDSEKERVSMLVRLAPGAEYPPHRHAGLEELYLLDGELMIDHKKLYPGDYNRQEAGTIDQRIWTETGCTCVLLTSSQDVVI